jgi:hypothetical protein
MNTILQTDIWITRLVIRLGLILVVSVVGILFLMITYHILSDIFVALGFVAAGGLFRLLISPLNSKLLD